MEQIIKYYYIQALANHLCPNHTICVENHFIHCQNLHLIQVGNGQFVSVLFMIPIIIDIHGHRFEVYTVVLEINENVDLVIGIKNIFELEGIINSQESCFSFLDRPTPIFPKDYTI